MSHPGPRAAAPPLEVPQVGPSLGRLVVPRRVRAPWVPLDDVREELATAVIELAGQGRTAASRGDWGGLARATGRSAWMAAWEHALQRVAQRLADWIDAEIDVAARRARMPRRRRRARMLSGAERRAIAARLGAGGGPFVAALDALDRAGVALRDGTGHVTPGNWQAAFLAAARRLEAAWLALEEQIAQEEARWIPEIEDAAAWRAPPAPLLLAWLAVAAALVWLGGVIGGWLPAPLWLAALLRF